MAIVSKLSIDFLDDMGASCTISYNYVKSDLSTSTVKNICAALLANGSILKRVPVEIVGARLSTTEETSYDLSD